MTVSNSDAAAEAVGAPSIPAESHFKGKPRQKWRKGGSNGTVLRPRTQNIQRPGGELKSKFPPGHDYHTQGATGMTAPATTTMHPATAAVRDPPQSPPAAAANTNDAGVRSEAEPMPVAGAKDHHGGRKKPYYRQHHKWNGRPYKGRNYRQKQPSHPPPHDTAKDERQERDDRPTKAAAAPKDAVDAADNRVVPADAAPTAVEEVSHDSNAAEASTGSDGADTDGGGAEKKPPTFHRGHGHPHRGGYRKSHHWPGKKHKNVGGRPQQRPRTEPTKEDADRADAGGADEKNEGTKDGDAAEARGTTIVSGEDAEEGGTVATTGTNSASSSSSSPPRPTNARRKPYKKPHRKFGAQSTKKKQQRAVTPPPPGFPPLASTPERKEADEDEVSVAPSGSSSGGAVTTNAAGAAILDRLASAGNKEAEGPSIPPPPSMSYAEATIATQTAGLAEALARGDLLGSNDQQYVVQDGGVGFGNSVAPVEDQAGSIATATAVPCGGAGGGYAFMAYHPTFPIVYDGAQQQQQQGYDVTGCYVGGVGQPLGVGGGLAVPSSLPVAAVAVQPLQVAAAAGYPVAYGPSVQYQTVEIDGTVHFVPTYSHPQGGTTTMNANAPVFKPGGTD